jgi:hypothetical protein
MPDQAHAWLRYDAVIRVATRQDNAQGRHRSSTNRMNLGISATFGVLHRLRIGPPFRVGASMAWLPSRVTWWGTAEAPATASNILTPFSLQRAKRL